MSRKEQINQQILDFLEERPLISQHGIEKKLAMPQSTIGQAFKGDRKIPSKHLYLIILELIQYGFRLDGFTWEQPDPQIPHIFGRKYVEDEGFEETEDGGFIYSVKEFRTMAADLEDLL